MKLNVYGQMIPVKRTKGLKELGMMGFYSPNTKSIEIDSTLRGRDYNETLMHEIIHSVFDAISLNTIVSLEVEEMVADNVAKCLVKNFTFKKKVTK